MLVKTLAHNLIAQVNKESEKFSPAKLLAIFNQSLKQLLKQRDKNSISNAGFDAAIVTIDKETNIITYAGANIPLFYMQDKQIKTIKADRHSIGYKTSDPHYIFNDHHIPFEASMRFYLTTDGYIDQNGGEKGFPMGKRRFKTLIETHTNQSMQEQQEILKEALVAYQKNEERNDDITVIGFRCRGIHR